MDDVGDLRRRVPRVHVQKRRKGWWRTCAVGAMANRALAPIGLRSQPSRSILLGNASCHRNVIGVDVDNTRVGVDCRPSPLRSAVILWKYDGLFSEIERNELSVAVIS